MSWAPIETALDGILARRWYTNHGPLAQELEGVVADTTEVRHAVAVTNQTIGLIMLAEALDLSGAVTLSALAPMRCVQALSWAGLAAASCDVDPRTLRSDPTVGPGVAAVLLSSRGEAAWADLAWDHGLATFSDGVVLPGVPAVIGLPGFGDDAGAGCVLTDDDRLAARLRNIRSSYGAGPPVPVRRTANGRLSEAQAAMALLAWPPVPPATAALLRCHPECRAIEFGDATGLVAETTAARDRLLATVRGAEGWRVSAAPGGCRGAEDVAARMVVVPHPGRR